MSSTSQERNDLPADEPLGVLEPVAHFNGAMPTGVTVSHQGRVFVNFPKWGDEVLIEKTWFIVEVTSASSSCSSSI